MTNLSGRTTASKWVYRMTLAVFTLLTLRFVRLVRDWPEMLPAGAEGASYWIAVTALLSAPLPIIVLTLSLYFRSGASLWLFGLLAIQTVPNLFVPILASGAGDSSQILILAIILVGVALPFVAMMYLVQKQELRRP